MTNPKIFARGIKEGIGNAILIKLNQIGSVSETIEAVEMARKANYASIISHRSGETEDAFIADFAVAMGAGQIKTGSASRTDRIAKYNQLLRIEEELGAAAKLPGPQRPGPQIAQHNHPFAIVCAVSRARARPKRNAPEQRRTQRQTGSGRSRLPRDLPSRP